MAGPFTGMDIQGVRDLAVQLVNKSGEIKTLMDQLSAQLGNTQWVGGDADRFRDEWQSHHCAALLNVMSGLEEAARRANNNAAEQETASS